MTVPREIEQMRAELTTWRRDIHAHPETAFAENRTSDLIAERLGGFGLEVHRGLAGTGVVGTLKCGTSDRSIGLRADMDALFLHEENDFAHRSTNDGKMHGCGHDVHTTMLLGAAKYLAGARNFDGTVTLHLPARRGNRQRGMRWQSHGSRRPVRAIPGRRRVRHAQLPGHSARPLRGARGADAGLDRYLRIQGAERAQSPGDPVHDARSDPDRRAHRRGVSCLQVARHQSGRTGDHEHHPVQGRRSGQRQARGPHHPPTKLMCGARSARWTMRCAMCSRRG